MAGLASRSLLCVLGRTGGPGGGAALPATMHALVLSACQTDGVPPNKAENRLLSSPLSNCILQHQRALVTVWWSYVAISVLCWLSVVDM